jgi:BMFP domain-containing protein YqiC
MAITFEEAVQTVLNLVREKEMLLQKIKTLEDQLNAKLESSNAKQPS